MSNICEMITWFPIQFSPINCLVVYLDLYILYFFFLFLDFSFVTTWSPCPPWPPIKSSPEKRVWYLSCDFVIPISVSTRKLPCYLFWFISLYFLFFLDFSFVTTWSPCPPWPQIKSSPEKKGLIFYLRLRDSHFKFHTKIAMISILIYIFFISSSFFEF